jgi:3D-(3,5/4)-trihydroxycyclohexane-1,2-dione acylhydrolase (decyclizing)
VTLRADSERELRQALERAKRETRTVVIHVPVQKDVRVPGFESWGDVPVAEASAESSVRAAREAYDNAKTRQRYLL